MSYWGNEEQDDPWKSYGNNPSYSFGDPHAQTASSLNPCQTPVSQSPSWNAPTTPAPPLTPTTQAFPAATLGAPTAIQPSLSQQGFSAPSPHVPYQAADRSGEQLKGIAVLIIIIVVILVNVIRAITTVQQQ
ncbi:Oidioi.mRNA.OKI2018_I69.chr1.g115.t1.cds [Oikopleura dioica]|uniref:Oidioi.mRNA.OKI2018_I69.chr1.g115.t1.cds n=1 Tax=Oikopleura dioica TaxID=34765 RepID=A0ABN7SR34_OIKDI|nr:Oidioi.mRNA.OKI2018_I69.chr1.g115.t1.cds [Oikopleura dioica]